MNIKKKLIAISLICAMAVSFSACSDKADGNDSGAAANAEVDETLSSEELQALEKQELTITPFNPGDDVQEDPVEGGDSSEGGSGNSQSGNDGNSTAGDNSNGGSASNGSVNGGNTAASIDASSLLDTTDVVIVPGGDNSTVDSESGDHSNTNNSGSTITGTKSVMQAWWLDLSKQENFVFDGEFITADFKIKEGTANGTYPITIEWLDFSNWEAQGVKFSGINGSVVVGSEATPNSFKNDGTPEIMAENVSGNPGDTVTVRFQMKNNPGIVACVFRFGYDSDALEYVGGGEGADFEGTFN